MIARELLKELFQHPDRLDELDVAWLPSGEEEEAMIGEVILTMMELRKVGVNPTPRNVADQSEPVDKEGVHRNIQHLIQVEESGLGLDYIIADLRSQYANRILFHICNEALKSLSSGENPDSVQQFLMEEFRKMPSTGRVVEMKKAVSTAMEDFESIYEGRTPAMWKTGLKKVDEAFKWNSRSIVVLAANQKVGKSRLVIALVLMMLKHQPQLKCIWFNFEMSEFEMVCACCAHMTGIDTGVINGKERMPTMEERERIKRSRSILEGLPIEFHGQPMRISEIRKIIAQHGNEKTVVVIDNLGLIKSETDRSDNQNDDHVAAELVDIRDSYGPLIIVLHHLSKEVTHFMNAKNFFRPQIRHIRGSARIADYANFIGLIHRVEMHESILKGADIGYEAWADYVGKMELTMAVGREGNPEEILLDHQLKCVRFTEV